MLALALAGFGLRGIFDREIERRAADDLGQIVKLLAAQVRIDARGEPVLDAMPPDPRFDTPYGGRYWQISRTDGQRIRSRSLWDFVLAVADTRPGGERRVTDLDGPNRSGCSRWCRTSRSRRPRARWRLQIVAAADRSEIAAAQQSFLRLLALSLAALGLILIVAMAVFVRLALRPFDELDAACSRCTPAPAAALRGNFPLEVQPWSTTSTG